MPSARRSRRSSHRRPLLAAGLGLAACAAAGSLFSGLSSNFVSGLAAQPVTSRHRVSLRAEEGGSVALVKVTEESKVATAGVLGGLVGVLSGGIWVGAALFAASSYASRKKDDDLANALTGISSASLDLVNYLGAKNNQYEVTSQLGSAITGAISSNEATKSAYDTLSETAVQFDKEVSVKDSVGTLISSGTELTAKAVSKLFELNDEYKPLDKIQEQINKKKE